MTEVAHLPRLSPAAERMRRYRGGGGMAIRASQSNSARAKFPPSFHADC